MSELTQLWVEKYRPSLLDGYIFQSEHQKTILQEFINDKSIPHLLLHGAPGSGKTTLAKILVNELGVESFDFLQVNASDDNSIDYIRNTIKQFAATMPIGEFKVILLDEADYITVNAQASLRNIMERYADNARFILTCNYPHKILDALRSRVQSFEFKSPDKEDILAHLLKILKKEKVALDEDTLTTLDIYMNAYYPDIRKILNELELNSKSGILLPPGDNDSSSDYKVDFLDNAYKGNWLKARNVLLENLMESEMDEVFTLLYNNVAKFKNLTTKNKQDEAIVLIAEHMCRHPVAANPIINLDSLLIRIGMLGEK